MHTYIYINSSELIDEVQRATSYLICNAESPLHQTCLNNFDGVNDNVTYFPLNDLHWGGHTL